MIIATRRFIGVRAAAVAAIAALLACAAPIGAQSSGNSSGSAPAAGGSGGMKPEVDSRLAPCTSPDAISTEPWAFGATKGQIIRTTHYRIYTTERNVVLRDRMVGFVERALTHYRSAIVPLPAPPQRLDTYLMDTRPQWEQVTKLLMAEQADTLVKIQRGGYASRGIGVYYDLGLLDTMSIAAHEGWHQYTQRTFKDGLPVWLEEGLATHMEGHRWVNTLAEFRPWANVERFDQLRKAKDTGKLADLETLLTSSPQSFLGTVDGSLLNYYAQVWALTHFLNEGAEGKYRDSLRNLLLDASEGNLGKVLQTKLGQRGASAMMSRTGPAVFIAYFNSDIEEAAREYTAFLDKLVQPGTRGDVVAGRSPFGTPASGVRVNQPK
ncbi:MAG TPA: DUF1570 domain-containing protein [Phycisphaerales bacterium]|nr:DUF1570 domain-containing protein [Phycisphaerales bacterium]